MLLSEAREPLDISLDMNQILIEYIYFVTACQPTEVKYEDQCFKSE